jgi:hypothetical protein
MRDAKPVTYSGRWASSAAAISSTGIVTGRESRRCRPSENVAAPAASHVSRRAAADRRHAQAREPRPHADDRVDAQERRDHRIDPRRAVVDEQALAPGRPARRHDAELAVEQLVALGVVEVLEQRVPAQARVGDELVEALHHRGLVEQGKSRELDRGAPHVRAEALAIERRTGDRVAHERLDPLALPRGQPLARPALARGQDACAPEAARDVDDPLAAVVEVHRHSPVTR